MTTTRIPASLRKLILFRDAGLCSFCRCAEKLMGVTFEIDHIVPRSRGGMTTLENLCVCCPTCNRHKAARTHASDPETMERAPLFHPVRDVWDAHFEWSEGATILVGRTPVGRTTVDALFINRSVMVELRRFWAAMGLHPPETRRT